MEWQEAVARMKQLMWKVFFYMYTRHKEYGDWHRSLSRTEQDDFFARLRSALASFYSALLDDEVMTADEESVFLPSLALLTYKLLAPEEVFDNGSSEIAPDFAQCILRYEGWQLKEGCTRQDFSDRIRGIDLSVDGPAIHVDQCADAILKSWEFVAEPEEVMGAIDQFRANQGNDLYAFSHSGKP